MQSHRPRESQRKGRTPRIKKPLDRCTTVLVTQIYFYEKIHEFFLVVYEIACEIIKRKISYFSKQQAFSKNELMFTDE